jgi:UDP-N-acetylmuramate dehydrogenase
MAPTIAENERLAKYTSWRIGGPARYFANAAAPEALSAALAWARERGLPTFVLGGGTNVLVRDAGFAGLVLRYRSQELRIDEATACAWVAAGAPMAGTARRLAAQGWAGLHWAEGLPGTIGGAVFGNAGCYGGDIASTLARAWLLIDGQIQEWPVERFAYGYRTSRLKAATTDDRRPTTDDRPTTDERQGDKETGGQGDSKTEQSAIYNLQSAIRESNGQPTIIAAEFNLARADPRALAERMREIAAERKQKTPIGSSCGSVFKNPPGQSAGRLIEAAGLKGMRVGAAAIAAKHANYMLNLGSASSEDLLRLIEIARTRVLTAFGVELELEVQIV